MAVKALRVRLEAKPGTESDVESFLRAALTLVQAEPAAAAWSAVRMGPAAFGIFDAFADAAGRQARLSEPMAAQLKEKAADLLSQPPSIEQLDALAARLPGVR